MSRARVFALLLVSYRPLALVVLDECLDEECGDLLRSKILSGLLSPRVLLPPVPRVVEPAATTGIEAVTTFEDTARTARRVFGGAHPTTGGIEEGLRLARAALRARETPLEGRA